MTPSPDDGLVWYVAYGSNLSADRFRCYLEGGTPPGGNHAHEGARDPTPARDTRGVWIPGQVYFAKHSRQWDGAIAFYDADRPSRAAARAYLVTAEQFVDVVAQETRQATGIDPHVIDAIEPGSRATLGPGWYETVVRLSDINGRRAFTFTCPWSLDDVDTAAPSAPYRALIALGLAEAFGWNDHDVAAHLASLPGIAPAPAS